MGGFVLYMLHIEVRQRNNHLLPEQTEEHNNDERFSSDAYILSLTIHVSYTEEKEGTEGKRVVPSDSHTCKNFWTTC